VACSSKENHLTVLGTIGHMSQDDGLSFRERRSVLSVSVRSPTKMDEFSKLIVVSFGDKFLIGVRRAGERPALYFGESRTFHLFVLIHSLLYSGLSSLVDRLACVVQTIFKITGRAVIDDL